MCLIFIAKNKHPDLPFILAANRDEFFARPSQKAHFWPSEPYMLAGKDLQASGTWLGLTRDGLLATVTNVRSAKDMQASKDLLSRGEIPKQLLSKEQPLEQSLLNIKNTAQSYGGFNLLTGSIQGDIHYLSNRYERTETLQQGIFGLSNASLDSDWPKVHAGKKRISELCQHPFLIEDWFELLANKKTYPNEELPQTGIDIELERLLSASFIHSESYGTRTSTVITLDLGNNVTFYERNFDALGRITETQCIRWSLDVIN
jgi:uncharacterized protein with NRDE domain